MKPLTTEDLVFMLLKQDPTGRREIKISIDYGDVRAIEYPVDKNTHISLKNLREGADGTADLIIINIEGEELS